MPYDRYEEFKSDVEASPSGYVGSPGYRDKTGMSTLEVGHYRRMLRSELREDGKCIVPTPTSFRQFATTVAHKTTPAVNMGRNVDVDHLRTRIYNLFVSSAILSDQNPEDIVSILESKALRRLKEAFDQFDDEMSLYAEMRRAGLTYQVADNET